MRYRRFLPILLALLLAWALPARADFVADPDKLPTPTGYVSDFAGMLNETTRQQLETLLTELDQKTGAQVAVLTVPSLGGLEPNDYAVRAFTHWGIGKKGKDEGVLFLIAPNDRKMFINTGYGAEGPLPDVTAHEIYTMVRDEFRAGRMNEGVAEGTVRIATILAEEHKVTLTGQVGISRPARRRMSPREVMLILLLFFVFVSIASRINRSGGRGGGMFWGGGGFGGGGFGGGGFGGGGSGGGGGFGGFSGGSTGGGGSGGGW